MKLINKVESLIFCSIQLMLFILYKYFCKYKYESNEHLQTVYPMFQDINVMLFVGFGYLMTFLKFYGYSALSFNFLLAAILLQWAILCIGLVESGYNSIIYVGIDSLIGGQVAVAAALISMGALLGKVTYIDLILMGFIEVPMYVLNKEFSLVVLKILDTGESIFVHTFGAYFGLGVSFMLKTKDDLTNDLETADYRSNLFSMIGTVFLWMYWPSFNGASLDGEDQQRAIINTYLALTSCCVVTFITSSFVGNNKKLAMEHIQNSTVAGGVAIGAAANLYLLPNGAILIGCISGILSVLGFQFISPWLKKKYLIHDTCGVNNLHGMPGILAGLIVSYYSVFAMPEDYGGLEKFVKIWPARSAIKIEQNSTIQFFERISTNFHNYNRNGSMQGVYQLFALLVTFGVSITFGLITGWILKKNFGIMPKRLKYNDALTWLIPNENSENGKPT